MTTEEHAILETIWDHPDDDTARLVYADHLEENGHIARADAIRRGVAEPERLTFAEGSSAVISYTSERPESRGGHVSVALADELPGVAWTVFKGTVERLMCSWETWLVLSAAPVAAPEIWLTTRPNIVYHGQLRVDDEAWGVWGIPGRAAHTSPTPVTNSGQFVLCVEFPRVRRWSCPVRLAGVGSADVGVIVRTADGRTGVLMAPVDGDGFGLVNFR